MHAHLFQLSIVFIFGHPLLCAFFVADGCFHVITVCKMMLNFEDDETQVVISFDVELNSISN